MAKSVLRFPILGLQKGRAVSDQDQNTSPYLNNVRSFDVIENRARGGQRPGLKKWGNGNQIGGAGAGADGEGQPIVDMAVVTLANPLPDPTPAPE